MQRRRQSSRERSIAVLPAIADVRVLFDVGVQRLARVHAPPLQPSVQGRLRRQVLLLLAVVPSWRVQLGPPLLPRRLQPPRPELRRPLPPDGWQARPVLPRLRRVHLRALLPRRRGRPHVALPHAVQDQPVTQALGVAPVRRLARGGVELRVRRRDHRALRAPWTSWTARGRGRPGPGSTPCRRPPTPPTSCGCSRVGRRRPTWCSTSTERGLVLTALSPVFTAELYGELFESGAHCVKIVGTSPDAFKGLLHFVYNDSLPPEEDDAEDAVAVAEQLFEAANLYGLDRMKVLCAERLSKYVDDGTVARVSELAGTHSCAELREARKRYLSPDPECCTHGMIYGNGTRLSNFTRYRWWS